MQSVVIVLMSIVVMGCSGSMKAALTGNSSAQSVNVSGRASAGPLVRSTISIYVQNADGTTGTLLGETVTDAKGNYALTLPAQSGPVILVASQGSYVEEATPLASAIPLGQAQIRTVLSRLGEDRRIGISPVTEIAVQRALLALSANAALPAATIIDATNAAVGAAVGLTNLTAPPADPARVADAASPDEAKHAVVLAALSKIAKDASNANSTTLNSMDLMQALATAYSYNGSFTASVGLTAVPVPHAGTAALNLSTVLNGAAAFGTTMAAAAAAVAPGLGTNVPVPAFATAPAPPAGAPSVAAPIPPPVFGNARPTDSGPPSAPKDVVGAGGSLKLARAGEAPEPFTLATALTLTGGWDGGCVPEASDSGGEGYSGREVIVIKKDRLYLKKFSYNGGTCAPAKMYKIRVEEFMVSSRGTKTGVDFPANALDVTLVRASGSFVTAGSACATQANVTVDLAACDSGFGDRVNKIDSTNYLFWTDGHDLKLYYGAPAYAEVSTYAKVGDDSRVDDEVTVTAVLGPVPLSASTLAVYRQNADGSLGKLLGSTFTSGTGGFTMTIPKQSGPVTFVASGGAYLDPTLGNLVPLNNARLRAVLPSVLTSKSVAITFFTEIAAQRSLPAIVNTPAASPAAVIAAVNAAVAKALGVADVVTPSTPADQGLQAVALRSLTKIAKDASSGAMTVGAFDLTQALATAFAYNGSFKATVGTTAIPVPNSSGATLDLQTVLGGVDGFATKFATAAAAVAGAIGNGAVAPTFMTTPAASANAPALTAPVPPPAFPGTRPTETGPPAIPTDIPGAGGSLKMAQAGSVDQPFALDRALNFSGGWESKCTSDVETFTNGQYEDSSRQIVVIKGTRAYFRYVGYRGAGCDPAFVNLDFTQEYEASSHGTDDASGTANAVSLKFLRETTFINSESYSTCRRFAQINDSVDSRSL